MCRCFNMDVDINRYVKYNKITIFLNLHFYGGVKFIKYIMSLLNIEFADHYEVSRIYKL